MQNKTHFHIGFAAPPNLEDSLNLQTLTEILRKEDIVLTEEFAEHTKGAKNEGLLIALNVITVGVSVIGTIINALQYFLVDNHPTYSATIETDSGPVTISTTNSQKLPELISEIKVGLSSNEIKILIAKR